MALIVVESPTKARTFNRILKIRKLDSKYYVFATVGHFRDLPSKSISVDVNHDFKPKYGIMAKKKKMLDKLKELGKEHKKVILATDPDREGEAISYHVAYVLGHVKEKWPDFKIDDKKVQRIIFHEITPAALEHALSNPEKLRIDLVKAQQARRILDRIVGYKISPILWKKTGKQWLSAGRVQTVALRLVVEREKEITAFTQEDYFQLFGTFKHTPELRVKLIAFKGISYDVKNTIKLFDGEFTYTKTTIDEKQGEIIKKDLNKDTFNIKSVDVEVVKKYPPPPFTTSLLQQDAFQKLGYPSKLTMRIAQSLYEKGFITYHRTDSFNLSTKFVFSAMDFITKKYGKDYALEKPRGYKTRSKNAQEAHEAIRPTKVDKKGVTKLNAQERKVYDLVFARALATQMKEAEVRQVKVNIHSKKGYEFEETFSQVLFDGFMKVLRPEYVQKHQGEFNFKKDTKLDLTSIDVEKKHTWPPYRYNEATLVRAMESKSIGRPSTYSSIISLIVDKNYVEKERRFLKPTPLGMAISEYLSDVFPNIFDLAFTAKMEDSLDEIALGNSKLVPTLTEYYEPLKIKLKEHVDDGEKIEFKEEMLDEKCPKCGGDLVAKFGKYGKFFACNNYPKCKFIKPNLKYVKGYNCPDCKGRLVVRYSKRGRRFYGCENYPKCKHLRWVLDQEKFDKKQKEKENK